jgi:hypothetical protein
MVLRPRHPVGFAALIVPRRTAQQVRKRPVRADLAASGCPADAGEGAPRAQIT